LIRTVPLLALLTWLLDLLDHGFQGPIEEFGSGVGLPVEDGEEKEEEREVRSGGKRKLNQLSQFMGPYPFRKVFSILQYLPFLVIGLDDDLKAEESQEMRPIFIALFLF
jgi:hypothetical protein